MRMLKLFLAPVVIAGLFSSLSYAAVPDRIPNSIDSSQMVQLKGNMHGLAQARYDLGRADSSRMLHGVTLVFHPSAAQQQDLENLLAEQQDRSSPYYHKWLTPAQFANRFGMSRGDIKRVTAWLQSQGFAVTGVANSRNEIYFDGTVSQVEVSFSTEIHNYLVDGVTHFGNATNPSVPAALSSSVLAVGHLHDFAPKPRAKVKSNLTSYVSGSHFLSPGDFATIYDLQPLYSAGADGTGQTIAVVGQSTVSTTDLNNFRSSAGLPASTVTMTLIEGTATRCAGDEGESDLDLEWSGGVAKNASIIFLYAGLGTGDTCTSRADSVWDALDYAVQHKTAPIISTSYGYCESGLGQTFVDTVEGWAQQGNLQGQTIMAAAGDSGAADCDPNNTDPGDTSATGGLAVDTPASIPEVTGMGGNTFNGDGAGVVTGTAPNTNADATQYWSGTTSSKDTISSALSYIPETAWNDTALAGSLSASGGGSSIYFPKPSWQTGTGVPADGKRDVPDLSVAASPNHDGYLICSEDDGSGGIASTCTSGFRTGAGGIFTIVGGTSAAAPTFSAILALINHYVGNTPPAGLGNINPAIYGFAATNPTAFHDVKTGNNIVPCMVGTPNCPTTGTPQFGFSAGVGYDQVTGWGSVDGFVLAKAWAATVVNFTTTSTGLSPTSVTAGGSTTATVTIAPLNGFTGTVTLSCSGLPTGATCAFSPATVSGGSGTSKLTIQTALSTPAGTTSVTVAGTSSGTTKSTTVSLVVTQPFTMAPTVGSFQVAQGASVNATVAVTFASGFTGTVTFTCTLPTTMTGATCTPPAQGINASGQVGFTIATAGPTASALRPADRGMRIFFAALLPGLLGLVFTAGSRRRSLRGLRFLGLIVVLGFSALWVTSCGGSNSSSNNSNSGTPPNTYTVSVTGTSGGATASTSFGVKVQ